MRLRRIAGFAQIVAILATLAIPFAVATAGQPLSNAHNLSVPGRATRGRSSSAGSCVFCHTPHDAKPTKGLWNRDLPAVTYRLYSSSTMKAVVRQPTGSSRLCLSCHDGIIAPSKVRKLSSGSIAQMPPITGRASLGTDLSDDHPVSFVYDSGLAILKGNLADPTSLPRTAPLEEKQVQCTSCHDPHDEKLPNFERIDGRFGMNCIVCHRDHNWATSAHATSSGTWRGGAVDKPWPNTGYNTMGENGCLSCHRVHAAPHPERLLAQTIEERNCTICHNGTMARQNIQQEFMKASRHQVQGKQWTHDPAEDPFRMPRHVTCVDCHNPHAAMSTNKGAAVGPLPGSLRAVSGMTISGAPIKEARFEYEICLKCHGQNEPTTMGIIRQDMTRSIAAKISLSNLSSHPIAAPRRNQQGIRLRATMVPPYNTMTTMTCTDCHNNDQWVKGGSAPRGPHGSRFEGILAAEYDTVDPSPESYSSYALCYKCHQRNALLVDNPMAGFPHKKHVVDGQMSCAVCHDPHGSRLKPSTINFELMSKQGVAVVRPAKNGHLEWVPDPARPGHGKCYMTCHNTEHNGTSY